MRAVLLVLPLALLAGCRSVAPASTDTVLAIDFLQTLPGEQADYLRFVDLNWRTARAVAQAEGAVVRYEVLAREPSEDEWDVMLITEYASEAAYAEREAIFARIFESPRWTLQLIDGKNSRDMASFVGEPVVVRRQSQSP
ncbi:MAG: hypothetical protein HKN04_13030 [Rhodothermaceae bacterium]|nr:hypothetical protein [Rhodothermaceae bacterium]